METISPGQNFARKLAPDSDRVPSPLGIVCAFAFQVPRKLFKNQDIFFLPKKLDEKESTAFLDVANNLGDLTPSSCVNAQAVMNNHFGMRAAEHPPFVNCTLANE